MSSIFQRPIQLGRSRRRTLRRGGAIVAAAAAIALLASCAGGGGGSAEPSADASAELPPSDTEATLEIWGYTKWEEPREDWIKRGISLLQEEFPNVEVNYSLIPYADLPSKILGSSVGGASPDGVIFSPTDADAMSQAGILTDMTPFWENFDERDEIAESVVWHEGDNLVALQGYINTTGLFYNQQILDEVGIEPPTTIEELDAALAAVTAAGYQGMALAATPDGQGEFQIMPWLLGEGQNYGEWDEATVESVFGQFTEWIDAGYIPRDVVGWLQADVFQQFTGGDIAFAQGVNSYLGRSEEIQFDWGVIPIPAGEAGSHSLSGGEAFSIGADTEYPALVWRLFQLMLLEEDAQVHILETKGSIPSRLDVVEETGEIANEQVKAFAEISKEMESRPSSSNMGEYIVAMGRIWNSVASGILSPADAAAQVQAELTELG